ncbi:Heptaprenyl diphosphate synthase component 2 [compost metagenome]
MAADAPDKVNSLLYRYGYNVGMAFQIRDDLLDLFGTEKSIGKPPGSDMRQGNITLPVLFALQEPGLREPLLREIRGIQAGDGSGEVSRAIEMIRTSSGIGKAEALADRFIAKALEALQQLPVTAARTHLEDIAEFVNKRSY